VYAWKKGQEKPDKAERADHPAVRAILFDTRVDAYTTAERCSHQDYRKDGEGNEHRVGKEGMKSSPA